LPVLPSAYLSARRFPSTIKKTVRKFRPKLPFKPGIGNDLIKLITLFSRMHPPIPEALIFRFFFACPIFFEKGLLARPLLNVT
jgi:hypothetical protein